MIISNSQLARNQKRAYLRFPCRLFCAYLKPCQMYSQTSFMKLRPVVGFHVCALELQSIFKMTAKFILKLSILPVNQHYYEQKTLN